MYTGRLRFDIPFLAGRLEAATGWVLSNEQTSGFDIGYFGASTGAAAALVASVQRPEAVRAIVSRGGRPDLALNVLDEVKPPVLLIVGGKDTEVIEMNRQAAAKLTTEHDLVDRAGRLAPLRGARQARHRRGSGAGVVRPAHEDARRDSLRRRRRAQSYRRLFLRAHPGLRRRFQRRSDRLSRTRSSPTGSGATPTCSPSRTWRP